MTLQFVDLFAGIGGFHEAFESIGARCVFASEIDPRAREIYLLNRQSSLDGPFNEDFNEIFDGNIKRQVPEHDILAAGFPCQPFSKSGFQRGREDIRGNHFLGIAQIIDQRRPSVVILENVRNLIGPKHEKTWITIRDILRSLGYLLPDFPIVFSPHLIPPSLGGTPQFRERVFIVAVLDRRRHKKQLSIDVPLRNEPVHDWIPDRWDLESSIIQDDTEIIDIDDYRLSVEEIGILEKWNDFVVKFGSSDGRRLPGFPLWADDIRARKRNTDGFPKWKINFVNRNHEFYWANDPLLKYWMRENNFLKHLPASRRKFEWQAGDLEDLWGGLIQLRPSGIRVKKPNYAPALVAMNQTSILGSRKRRLTVREAARLQGFDDSLSFGAQPNSISYKQLGNAVAPKTALFVLRECANSWSHFPNDIRLELNK